MPGSALANPHTFRAPEEILLFCGIPPLCRPSPAYLAYAPPMIERPRLSIGEVQLWADRHELHRDGNIAHLPPRLVQLLLRLAATPEQTVTREQLLEAAWRRRVVNDEVLSRSIADLRQVLGDDPREPRYIVTVPKLGYRLIAPVAPLVAVAQEPSMAVAQETPVSVAQEPPVATVTPKETAPKAMAWRSHRALLVVLAALGALVVAAVVVTAWELRRVPEDGAARLLRAQPLTSTPGLELAPRLSTDGTRVLFAESIDEKRSRIMLRTLASGEQRALTPGEAWDTCPVFAGDDVIYTRFQGRECQLVRQSSLSDHAQVLTACAPVRSCPESAEGSIWFTAPSRGLARLMLADGSIVTLTAPPKDAFDIDPKRIHGHWYFSRGNNDERSFHRLVDGREETMLPGSMLYGYAPGPSPELILATDALGFRALVAFNPDSGATALLGARGARYPDAIGDTLVFELAQYDANLWLHRSGEPPRRLTPSNRYDAYPVLTPDDRAVIYQSNREGTDSLFLMDLASGAEQRLPAPRGERWAHPAFIDSRSMLLTRYRGDDTDIIRYTLGAERAVALSLPPGAHDARMDTEGRVWYLLGSGEAQRLHRADSEASGVGQLMLDRHVDEYALAADSWVVRTGTEIARCSERCVPLDIALDVELGAHWMLRGSSLYVVLEGGANYTRIEGDRRTPTDWPASNTLARGLSVAGDGSFAIVARTDALDVDLHWVSPAFGQAR